jgi:hypothetical protein
MTRMNFWLSKDGDVLDKFALEVNLKSEPELVAGSLFAAGSKQNRIANRVGNLPGTTTPGRTTTAVGRDVGDG